MSSEYCISVPDWNPEEWEFTGLNLEEKSRGLWSEDNQNGITEDDFSPMMMHAYPLYGRPADEAILKIHKKTCLTVVRSIESEEFYLALCGGGMDCSQDIGMAYIIAEGSIPYALAMQISRQPNVTQKGADFVTVMEYCRMSVDATIAGAQRQLKEIAEAVRQSQMMTKHGISHVSGLDELEAAN